MRAIIPDEAIAVLSSYRLGGQGVISKIDDVQLLTKILVEHSSTNRAGLQSSCSQSGQISSEFHDRDDENFNPHRSCRVTLRGMGGIGKTTVAAMVVHEPEIRYSFDHICWVNIGKRFSKERKLPKLQLSMYFDCLQIICQQISLDAREFFIEHSGLYLNPADSALRKAAKEVQAMERAKIKMSQQLQDRKVLIVLDDLWDNGDCDWFDFNSSSHKKGNQVLFVTTRTDDDFRFSLSITINMNLFSEKQAISLFFMEAGVHPLPELSPTDYNLASNIVRQCGYLPIAVKTAGRLFRYGLPDGETMQLKDVAKHVLMISTLERAEYSESYSNLEGDQYSIKLFHILDRTFTMVMSENLKNVASLFFAAFAIVFSQDNILCPWVPYESARILWSQLKKSDYFSYFGIKNLSISTNELLEGLRKIGVISVDMSAQFGQIQARKYRISHDLMWQYGRQCASLLNEKRKVVKEVKKISWLPSWNFFGIRFNSSWVEELQDTAKIDWNRLLADQYKVIIERQVSDINCEILNTALFTLPLHMLNALQFNEVFGILTNERFVEKRLLILGFEICTRGQIADIKMLPGFEISNSISTVQKRHRNKKAYNFSATFCLNFYADIIWKLCIAVENKNELAQSCYVAAYKSLVEVGRTLQEYSSWNSAMECFYKGLELCRKAGCDKNHVDVFHVLQLIKSSSPQRIVLVPFSSPNRIVLANSHILRKKNNQQVSLELSSHSKCSILPMTNKFNVGRMLCWSPYLEIGCGPKENAMIVTYDGTFITRVDDGAVLNVAYGKIQEGSGVNLKKGPKTLKEQKRHKKMSNGSRAFIVNMNGTVSPASNINLVLGVECYPMLRLVKRNSPNLVKFRNAKLLNDFSSKLKREDNDIVNGIGLDLISHQGFSLVPMLQKWLKIGPFLASAIGRGPDHEMLRAHYYKDGQIYLPKEKGYIRVLDGKLEEGQPILAVKTAAWLWLPKAKFVVNFDGSISPYKALHLGFGFYEPVYSHE